MGSLSDYAENALLKHLTTEAAYSPAATLYVALATADPTDAATGASMNEVANSGSYARAAITFGAASSRRVTQSGAVTFPAATGAWGTVSHYAIVDSGTYGAGNVLASGSFSSSIAVVSGNTFSIATTQIYIELTASGGLSNYFANGFLDRMFRNQAFTISANYAGLTTATVSDSNTGSTITEVSGGSYARVQINTAGGASPAWSSVSGNSVANNQAVSFPTPSGNWGTVTSGVLCDAATAGNLLAYWNDFVDQAITSPDTSAVSIGAASLTITQT